MFKSVFILGFLILFTNFEAFSEVNNQFLSNIQNKLKVVPKVSESSKYRILKEYGALWLNQNPKVKLPAKVYFSSEAETQSFHQELNLINFGANCLLQDEAAQALKKAQIKAKQKLLSISPRGKNEACLRSFDLTQKLWLSRVEPNLKYYVQNGKLSANEASLIQKAKSWNQVDLILKLEKDKKLLFDKYRQTSILNSVAAPGTSQHLSGLAFDLAEFENPQVRKIMNEFGWFQTVQNDLPHFTYLGNSLSEKDLINLGLKKKTQASFTFWIPNL